MVSVCACNTQTHKVKPLGEKAFLLKRERKCLLLHILTELLELLEWLGFNLLLLLFIKKVSMLIFLTHGD